MPGSYPAFLGDVCNGVDYGAVLTTSYGTTVTAGATLYAKGNWAQLGTLSADVTLLHISAGSYVASKSSLLDIGIGPSGSQVPIFTNLPVHSSTVSGNLDIVVPIDIPKGTVLWARCNANAASNVIYVKANGFSGGFLQPAGYAGGDTVGYTQSWGTTITSGAANTKSSFQALTAGTTRDYSGIIVMAGATTLSAGTLLDIAIGPSGSQQIIVPNIQIGYAAPYPAIPLPMWIPAGTPIWARSQSTIATSAASASILGLYG